MARKQTLEGVKVADFTWHAVGPLIMRELALNGATVVRIECHRRLCSTRAEGPYKDNKPGINSTVFSPAYNTNKYNISVDLNRPEGVEAAKRLVMWADIVGENFTPKAMRKWGLDYESLKKLKPDIIMFSSCQQGQSGPYSSVGGGGNMGPAMSGMVHATGWPDREPGGISGPYADFTAPFAMIPALIAALVYRRKTGRGLYLDQAQREAMVTFVPSSILDYTVNGRIMNRDGNRFPAAAPHNAYPCRGNDRWVAISVFTDEEWTAFCKVIGQPEWTKDAKFATLSGRKENEAELDRLVGEWTKNYTAEQVMAMLQAAEVAAGVVQTGEDLHNDPQLKYRQHFRVRNHSVMGPVSSNAPAYRLSKTPCEIWRPGPCLGEDNEYVFKEILGYSDDDIADLLAKGVITTEADLPVAVEA